MAALPDLLSLRRTRFVLWLPGAPGEAPALIIGRFKDGDPPQLAGERRLPLQEDPGRPGVWSIDVGVCHLADGEVYHYFFEVEDRYPGRAAEPIRITDPTAWTVDWRLLSPELPAPYDGRDRFPAAVVKVRDGGLVCADPEGDEPDWAADAAVSLRPSNNRTVMYELPTQWVREREAGGVELPVGTFQDVLALVVRGATSPNFPQLGVTAADRSYLTELGVTTLQLLPIEDSCLGAGWKYGTTNYLAPDHELGLPEGATAPTANADLARLVSACHRHGIRIFLDAVMGYARQDAYRVADYCAFHVPSDPPDGPGVAACGAPDPEKTGRMAWGGDLWKYDWESSGYDPVSGAMAAALYPARRLMLLFIARWVLDQRIDGVRIDSVDTVHSWNFVGDFRDYARGRFVEQATEQGATPGDAEARFLVVGEYLAMPTGLVRHRVDAMWNETFKWAVRDAILGRPHLGDPDFETTIRKLIDPRGRIADIQDGAEIVNYVTSHDVANGEAPTWSARLFDYLGINGVVDRERRIKLAFAVLLTAVGIPMILAGEEFADQHDNPFWNDAKQTDPVDFSRLNDPWRQRVWEYVRRLVRLRTTSPALGVNDTALIHVDTTPGRKVFAWRRGGAFQEPVVVVANFSDYASGPEYVIPAWPDVPGRRWRDVTQGDDPAGRPIAPEWVGREGVFPWEAKVYALA